MGDDSDPVLTACMIGVVAALLGLLLIIVIRSEAHAHWNPLTSGISAEQATQYSSWFVTQRQEESNISCCGDEEHAGGDGHYVDVRHIGDTYQIFVRELGIWVIYPNAVNPSHKNPTGQNVAWYKISRPKGSLPTITWYCLRLAEGT